MKKTYIYVDNSKGVYVDGLWCASTLFECRSYSILDADELFKNKTGIDVTKKKHIGVEIHG